VAARLPKNPGIQKLTPPSSASAILGTAIHPTAIEVMIMPDRSSEPTADIVETQSLLSCIVPASITGFIAVALLADRGRIRNQVLQCDLNTILQPFRPRLWQTATARQNPVECNRKSTPRLLSPCHQ
jgi:hypothetical protein